MDKGKSVRTSTSTSTSEKVTVWCGFTAWFIVSFFFGEIGPAGPATCTVNGVRYESLLRNHVIPALQQRHACMASTIFMQDCAPPQCKSC
ncbi:hypothetical protein AVEN_115931-1 [Araneus ventricosus]|uniref:Uncharacterized protein n=1 Tax=Araneus ventricosus TaxID=182803 RepID=A0A4Y2JNV9_ARAVE|nr:hypothetical protein AVEN_115931-1 [Araneus ventricosus]